MRRVTMAGLLAVSVLLLTGCDEVMFGNGERFKEDFHIEQAMKPGSRLSVENLNGSVEILGWEKEGIELTGTKYASRQDDLSQIKIDVQPSADGIRVRTVTPTGFKRWGNLGARYVIRVPYRTELAEIKSSNGGLKAEGLEGNAHFQTSNGSVRITRLRGNVDAHTSNGSVELQGVQGTASLRTSNGAIRVDDIKGQLGAETSNGSITAKLSEPEANRPIQLESSNGSIDLTLGSVRNNPVKLTTSNSSITLRLPPAAGATVNAHTSNASISTEFDVNMRAGQQLSKGRMEGTINNGGPEMTLSTSNGGIKLLKAM